MAKFIKCNNGASRDGNEILINIENISKVEPYSDGNTRIVMANGDVIRSDMDFERFKSAVAGLTLLIP